GDPLRRIVSRGTCRDPVAAPGLLHDLTVAGIENRHAVVLPALLDQTVQRAHDARLVGVRQGTDFVAELLAVDLADLLDVLDGRVELRNRAAVVAYPYEQRHFALDL